MRTNINACELSKVVILAIMRVQMRPMSIVL